jgi:hypothetical protein
MARDQTEPPGSQRDWNTEHVSRDSRAHEVLAAHVMSGCHVTTEGRGRVVEARKLRLTGADNPWSDRLVGCAVAASL